MPTELAPKLTQLSHGAGCGCKLRPADLAHVLGRIRKSRDRRLLVGPTTRDDAAVFRISKDKAIVSTTDFFTPVVDDPFLFGRIAAANALSDVYAMGGKPLFALSLIAFPLERMGADVLGRIVEGAVSACDDAGIEIVGGHSIDDPEPKFGLAVTGEVHPKFVLSNARAKAGDAIVLTKPLGIGLATTAIKKGIASEAIEPAIRAMSTLNRAAGEVFSNGKIHALTDITGFGLLGHLWNVVEASGVTARLQFDDVPLLPGVEALITGGIVPGGSRRNLADVATHVSFPGGFPEWKQLILADAQTNGGLLATVPRSRVDAVMRALKRRRVAAQVIGRIEKGKPQIRVESKG